jgi:hypothetical protein
MMLLILIPLARAGQPAPNFSGDWVLITATTSGARSTGQAGRAPTTGETRTTTNTASGAAFNCGRGCTILHKDQTLTIDKALLGSNTQPAQRVTLQLDGRENPVIDSFSPNGEIPATAQWNGNKLEISSSASSHTIKQLVSLEGAQLVVVTSFGLAAAQPVRFTYRKK